MGARLRAGAALAVGTTLALTGLAAPPAHAAGLTFTVTNLDDAGPGSLRYELNEAYSAPGHDTVVFAAGLTGTVRLTSAALEMADPITLVGPGRGALVVDGGDTDRVLDINSDPGDDIAISGLTFTRGRTGGDGAGLRLQDADLTLTDVSITHSLADGRGGGLAVLGGGRVTLRRTFVTNNGAAQGGGGVAVDGATAFTLEASDVSANTSGQDGGGLLLRSLGDTGPELALLTGSTLAGNVAARNGGALAHDETDPADFPTVVRNSTIAANRVNGTGGGAWLQDAATAADSVTFVASTVAGNVAAGVGGILGQTGRKVLQNTVVSDNTPTDLGLGTFTDPTFELDYSLVEKPAPSSFTITTAERSLVGKDPLLGPLTDNGGGLATMVPAYASILVDHGRGVGLSTDERGLPRPVDLKTYGNPTGGDGSDIGAVELSRLTCQGKEATLVAQPGRRTRGTSRNDVIVGTSGRDRITAKGGRDRVCALDGDDRVKGGGGKDSIEGGAGADRLFGNAGNDRLRGGAGKDRVVGGAGDDDTRAREGRQGAEP
jgi:hypothetical protein